MKKTLVIFLLCFIGDLSFLVGFSFASPDPTQEVNRLRIVMTTTADWSQLSVPAGRTIVFSQGSLTGDSLGIAAADGNSIRIWNNTLGSPSSAQFDVLVSTAGLADGVWQITKGWRQSTHVDIYNLNDVNNPVLIASQDDTEPQGDAHLFTVSGQTESRSGPLSAGNMGPKRVFAVYYPWWTLYNNWSNNWSIIDSPLVPYNTESQSDVAEVVNQAASNGIDGFLASWQGSGNFSDAGFQALLSAAGQRQDFTVAAYLETRMANAARGSSCLPDAACQPDPAYLKQWITNLVQNYGSSPAYLRMNKKMPNGENKLVPVIIVYWVGDSQQDARQNGYLSPNQWKQIFSELHSQGVDAFYVADSTDPTYLDAFDGLHAYNPAPFTNFPWFVSTRSLATKTYSLLTDPGVPRKLWAGTAVPGMDATRVGGGYVDRAGSTKYRSMWETNLNANPDWMIVTSWNEYLENTHIEPSTTYGNSYLDATRSYAQQFKTTVTSTPLTMSGINTNAYLPAGMEASWLTNRPATTVLEYGVTSGVYSNVVNKSSLSEQHRLTVPGLQPGVYYARVRSQDAAGIEAVGQEFQVSVPTETQPTLSIYQEESYWADYASYTSRQLRVDFRIANTGPGNIGDLVLNHLAANSGVEPASSLPLTVGDLPVGREGRITVDWHVPESVLSFRAYLWASAVTGSGAKVYYPEVPPDDA